MEPPLDPTPPSVEQATRAGADGSVDIGLLARALAAIEALHLLPGRRAPSPERRGAEGGSPAGTPASPGSPGAGAHPPAGREAPDGSLVPFLFTDGHRARAFARETGLAEGAGPVLTLAAPPSERIRECLAADYGGVELDPGSEHSVILDRPALERLDRELAGAPGGPRDDPGPDTPSLDGGGGSGSLLVRSLPPRPAGAVPRAVRRLGRVRIPPPVPPPGRSPAESDERLKELARSWSENAIAPWEFLNAISHELDLWVPVDPEPAFGLPWPLVARHPDGSTRPVFHAFSSESVAGKLAQSGDGTPELRHLSGIEALRWMWAAPTPAYEYHLHYGPGARWLRLHSRWALSAIYPHFLDVPRLDQVPLLPPDRLGRLAGDGGARPRCVRSLVENREALLSLVGSGGEDPILVERGGRDHLPIFSGRRALDAFEGAGPDRSAGRRAPAGRDPFRRWLLASLDGDGAILDPGSSHPLLLDHTDLLLLSLWARHGEQPDGTHVAGEVAGLVEEIGPEGSARILGDWPRYILLSRRDRRGGTDVVTLPGRERLAGFTNRVDAERYLTRFVRVSSPGGRLAPIEHLTRWLSSFFERLEEHFPAGARLDPRWPGGDPRSGAPGDGGGGLEVTPTMIPVALERIEEKLTPRVEGFRP